MLAPQDSVKVVARPVKLLLGLLLLKAPGKGSATVVNVHHTPAEALVVPPAARARTCHSYFVEFKSADTVTVRAVPVLTQLPSQTELMVRSKQYSYEAAEVLAPHESVRVVARPVWLLVGLVFAKAPGIGSETVVNAHHTPAEASVVPPAFLARTCHSYFVEFNSPETVAVRAVPELTQLPSHAELMVESKQYSYEVAPVLAAQDKANETA